MIIDKAKKNLTLFMNGRRMAEFPVTFGIDPESDKYKAFDYATPEGLYFVTHKKSETRFHRLLGISYPNLAVAEKGLIAGVISLDGYEKIFQAVQKSRPMPCNTGLGCGIALHGGGVYRYFGKNKERDWTEGCVALNNNDMEKLYDFCSSGDMVIIFNGNRNLYGIIRPFTHIKNFEANGVPNCPNGICIYEVELSTSLGRMRVTIKEGKEYGRSIQATVYKIDVPEKPLLVLFDRNADGDISFLDSTSGILAEDSPAATYKMVKEAVIIALSQGDLPELSGGRLNTVPR